MPKVIINKHQAKSKAIGCWVVMWLRRAEKTMKDLGTELGMSQQAVSYKIKANAFTYSDLLTIFDFLNVPDEEILMVMKIY